MATAENSFLDSALARLMALVLAILLGVFLYMNYSQPIADLFASRDAGNTLPQTTSEPAKPVNAELQACLEQRVGDVDRMKEEGILSDEQYANFRSRAEDLCRAQNPG